MAKEEGNLPRRWSDDEISLLKKQYAEKPTTELANQLGRSLAAVRCRAHMLGLKRKIEYEGRWTPEDMAVLKELYPESPIDEIAKRLGRTVNAVENRAHQLGVKRKSWSDRLWTAEEIELLKELYPNRGNIEEIAKRIGRSPAMVRTKAHKLGFVKRHKIYDL